MIKTGLLVLVATSLHCGGGGRGGDVLPSTCITFSASAAPGSSMVVAQQGSGSQCDLVEVELVVTDVDDVFAASFIVVFDAALAQYQGTSLSGSLLTSDGAQVQVVERTLQAGQVSVGLSRLGTNVGGIDFTGTGSLVKLLFQQNPGAGTAAGSLTFGNPRLLGSETPPQEKTGVQWSGGSFQLR